MDLSERKNADARRHPWESARAAFFIALLAEHDLLETRSVLDVGAGDAWFAGKLRRDLPADATVTCWDPNYTPADLEEGDEGVVLTADRPRDRFDGVLMLDVIEHVEDGDRFVSETVHELLADAGWALVSVPAHEWLFSSHDRTLRHHRRYSPRACRSVLERSGLAVVAGGGLFHSLLPIRMGQVALERSGLRRIESTGVGDWTRGPATTRTLTNALIADGKLSLALSRKGRALPGLSYWALCRRCG